MFMENNFHGLESNHQSTYLKMSISISYKPEKMLFGGEPPDNFRKTILIRMPRKKSLSDAQLTKVTWRFNDIFCREPLLP